MKKYIILTVGCLTVAGALIYLAFTLDSMGIISFERMFKRQYPLSFYVSDKGTAERAEGSTVVVSVFVSDKESSWNDEATDAEEKRRQLEMLGMATDWISEQAEQWGKSAEFAYNWAADSELYYEAEFDSSLTGYGIRMNDGYNVMWDFLNNEVRSRYLKEKYAADNIIYMIYFDTPTTESGFAPCAKDCYLDPQFSYDSCYLLTGYRNISLSPPVVAHEILHLYGAIDLYKGGPTIDFYGNNNQFVKYCRENIPDDIMLSETDRETGEPYYDSIPREISVITAYYLGWTDERPAEIDKYGLDYSSHDPDRDAQIAEKYGEQKNHKKS